MKKILCTVFLILLSVFATQAQKKEAQKENIYVKLKEGKNPIIYVDGKKFDFPMELIDQSKIESVFVVKGKEAIQKYNSPNGVILIKTKETKSVDFSDKKIKNDIKVGAKNVPKVIIDGKVSNRKILDQLKPNQIEKMEVVKGEKAIKKYNAPNGVIIITTKKN